MDHCGHCGLRDSYCTCMCTPQSGVEGVTLSQQSKTMRTQNMTFSDYNSEHVYTVDSETDNTRRLQDTEDVGLGDFLSRPVAIQKYQWTVGFPFSQNFNPWVDFITNPRVANRISNFNMFRGKLCLKAVINGNSFQYGRAILAYHPLYAYDELSTHSALVPEDLVQTSQLPHIFLDPNTSQGGILKCPFLWHYNYCTLTDAAYANLGNCFLRSLNDLKHANGADDAVDVTIFAWMEDVTLAVPTQLNVSGITNQMGDEVDEANTRGIISGPASAIARMAQSLSGIGAISPYMIATSKVAGATAMIAKKMGYCAPIISKAPDPYVPRVVGQLATCTVPRNHHKLTVDDKQELSIDPRIAGLSGDDPLNIKNIAMRESYITQFDWSIASPTNTPLWYGSVTPLYWAEDAGGGFHFPACAMAAQPFHYWTGTIKFRFQIVCSSFHKGRLKITYDPNKTNVHDEFNTNFVRIVDIAQETDFTVEIGIGKEFTYCRRQAPGVQPVNTVYFTNPGPLDLSFGNGMIGVQVLNELTVPNSTVNNDIKVNVFVSAGDDFEVAVPESTHMLGWSFAGDAPEAPAPAPEVIENQSGVEDPDAQGTMEPSAPMHEMTDSMGVGTQNLSDISKVFIGETISSFRTLLKRACLFESIFLSTGTAAWTDYKLVRPGVPYCKGFVPGAIHDRAAGGANYNYCNFLLYHWVRYAFQGQRGSQRWTSVPMIFTGAQQSQYTIWAQRNPLNPDRVAVAQEDAQTVSEGANVTPYNALDTFAQDLAITPIGSLDGACVTNAPLNTPLEFEIPYYSNARFTPGKRADVTSREGLDPTYSMSVRTYTIRGELRMWHSVGEDFQVYMYTGLPRLYFRLIDPAPALG